ncbi:hypothetical protein MASR2M78_17790 [Treponema sp.]
MRSLIHECAKRPVAVIMALSALLVAGLASLLTMNLEKSPPLWVPRVAVEAAYPGLGAQELRSLIALPLEDALASVSGLEGIRTICRDGRVIVSLDFRWGESSARAAIRVREAIDGVYGSLPQAALKPIVLPLETGREPLMVLSVSALDGDPAYERRLADYDLRAALRRIEGISRVTLVGGQTREIHVRLDLQRLASRGMNALDVFKRVSMDCSDSSAGMIHEADKEVVVVASGRPHSVGELASLVLAGSGGPYLLSSVADVREASARMNSAFVCDGQSCVGLEIYLRNGADPVATAKRVRKELASLVKLYEGSARITILSDSSLAIQEMVGSLASAALLGSFAAGLVIAVFLKEKRLSLLIALSIPLSSAATISALCLAGRSLNSMSLGGLALSIGLISDNAVIVLDALSSAFASSFTRPSFRQVSKEAASVAGSTLASLITTAIVFIPILFLPGPLGSLFGDLAFALIAANLAAWLFSLFALPALYRTSWKRAAKAASSPASFRFFLRSSFRHPLLLLVGVCLISCLGAGLTFSRPLSFLAPEKVIEILVEARFSAQLSLERVSSESASLSESILEFIRQELGDGASPVHVFGRAGSERDDLAARLNSEYLKERLVLHCPLPPGLDTEFLRDTLQAFVTERATKDIQFTVFFPPDIQAELLGLSSSTKLCLRASSLQELNRESERLRQALLRETGSALASFEISPQETQTEYRAESRREAAAHAGLAFSELAGALRLGTEGEVAALLEKDGRNVDIRISGQEEPASMRSLSGLPLISSVGLRHQLGDIAKLRLLSTKASLARFDRSDVVYIKLEGANGKGAELEALIKRLGLSFPTLSRSDESVFRRYSQSLILSLALVILLLYLALGAQFESFSLPLLILSTIPLSLSGAGPALLLSGSSLDSGSVLGLIVLFGTVVNNAIVMYERSAESGAKNPVLASYIGAVERFRSVLITTITTLVSLIPILVFASSATQRSMAATLLGGTLASSVLTLFVAPLLFTFHLRRRP